MSTVFQDNADTFATRGAERINQERHAGVRAALGFIAQGQPGRARYELERSLLRQARVAGVPYEPTQTGVAA